MSYSDDFAQNKPDTSEYTKTSDNVNNLEHNDDLQLELEVDDTNPNIFEKSPPKSTIGDKTLSDENYPRKDGTDILTDSYQDNAVMRNQEQAQNTYYSQRSDYQKM